MVACGALLDGTDPVRIGRPLDGWDLAVVDADGHPVPEGASGELIIGGVGLARYLDPEKDAEKYAAMPTLGWDRAYRSGDVVRNDPAGLVFAGRADDQIKLGGRRIELGEIDGQLLRLPGVVSAAAAVRSTKSGNKLLVGYVAVDDGYDASQAMELLRHRLPAALVPRLAVVDSLPTRTSGKVDRDTLPWPLPKSAKASAGLAGTQAWIAGDLERRARRRRDLAQGRLLRLRRGLAHGRPGGQPGAREVPRGRRRRRVHAVHRRHVRRCPGRDGRPDGQVGPPGRPDPAQDPDRPAPGAGAVTQPRGGALAELADVGLDRRPAVAGLPPDLPGLAADPELLVLPGAARPDDAGGGAGADRAAPGHAGRPPSRRQGAPPDLARGPDPGRARRGRAWRAHRGSPTTLACSGRRSATVSTCTRCRR